jgi:rhodanese-related sulfurtransferase
MAENRLPLATAPSAPAAEPGIAPAPATIGPEATMAELLAEFPGAQRALFRRYHIGGCSSCGFKPTETLRQVCERNAGLDVAEVLAQVRASHQEDEKIWIAPAALAAARTAQSPIKLVDIRSRDEFEATRIEGSVLLSQPVMQEIMGHWPRDQMLVIIDHLGKQGLDAAAYFAGHGFTAVRCLRGGIDAWSLEIEPQIKRYRLG